MEYKILKKIDKNYPEKLRNIKNPPERLYYIGNLELLKRPIFAVIGTREITDYGRKICKRFTSKLSENFVIISGMAVGTDTIAHEVTIENKGKTIAVLGSGFNNIFPEENTILFYEIIKKGGLILTEYAPNIKPKSKNFPERNRIVSGLSDGVLIIEAAYRSGTSITANLAKQQGKNVFAIPGRLDSKYGVGVNRLLQENIAKLVTETKDILDNYPQIINEKWITQHEECEIKEEYKPIYELLEKGTKNLEEILLNMQDKNITQIMSLLTKMEIEGLIVQEIGVGYKIK